MDFSNLKPLLKFGIEQEGIIVANEKLPYMFNANNFTTNSSGARFGCDGSSNTQETATDPVFNYNDLEKSLIKYYSEGKRLIPEGCDIVSIPFFTSKRFRIVKSGNNSEYTFPCGMHVTTSLNENKNSLYNLLFYNNDDSYEYSIKGLNRLILKLFPENAITKIEGNLSDERQKTGYGRKGGAFRLQSHIKAIEFRMFGACASIPELQKSYLGIYLNTFLSYVVGETVLSEKHELLKPYLNDNLIISYNNLYRKLSFLPYSKEFFSNEVIKCFTSSKYINKYSKNILGLDLNKAFKYISTIYNNGGLKEDDFKVGVFKAYNISKDIPYNNSYKWCYSCHAIFSKNSPNNYRSCNCNSSFNKKLLVSSALEELKCDRCNQNHDNCICKKCNYCNKYNDEISEECTCVKCDDCNSRFYNIEKYNYHLCPECNTCQLKIGDYDRSSYTGVLCRTCGSHFSYTLGTKDGDDFYWIKCYNCDKKSSTIKKAYERCNCEWKKVRTIKII